MKAPSFRIFGGVFTVRLIPTIMALVITVAMLGLGIWQMNRLEWKTLLIETMRQRMLEPEIDIGLSQIMPETYPKLDFHPGKANGTFENDKALFLNATKLDSGEGGYHILVPLKLEDGRYVLVDRGWIPYGLKDKPQGNTPSTSLYRPQGKLRVTGILRLPPDKKPSMRPENDTAKNVWYWMDLPAMASAAGVKEFMPFVLNADDAPHDGSYPIGAQIAVDLPNHHLQYALTWFWLSFILPVIYLVSSWKKDVPVKKGKKKEEKEAEKEAEKTS